VPDGLAATVVGWVLETRHAQGRKLGGEVVVGGVGVEEGFIAVTGGEEGLLLVRGQAKGVVGVGCRVAYEWPWWEVEVQGRVWRMCVFWSVVDGVVEGDDEMLF